MKIGPPVPQIFLGRARESPVSPVGAAPTGQTPLGETGDGPQVPDFPQFSFPKTSPNSGETLGKQNRGKSRTYGLIEINFPAVNSSFCGKFVET